VLGDLALSLELEALEGACIAGRDPDRFARLAGRRLDPFLLF